MRKLYYWLRAWNGRRRLRHILKVHPEAFKDLFDGQTGIYKHTLVPKYQCPKCGLYVSPLMHPEIACERVRALYPMLLRPLEQVGKDE